MITKYVVKPIKWYWSCIYDTWILLLILYHALFKHLNPLAGLRMAGPWGFQTIGRMRPDIIRKFEDLFDNEEDANRVVSGYLYHGNVHNPTGESAFHSSKLLCSMLIDSCGIS